MVSMFGGFTANQRCARAEAKLLPLPPKHIPGLYRDQPDDQEAQQTSHRALHRLVNSTSSGTSGIRAGFVRRYHRGVG